jgi:hypothetical protein
MGLEPFTESAIRRIGSATFDAYEAIATMVASNMGRDLRAAIDEPSGSSKGGP